MTPPESTTSVGTSLPSSPFAGRYTIERELGRGGMATVYLARDTSLDRHVAVKVLHRDLASHLGGGRFTREIRITSQLRHPGILPLLDSGEVEGVPFYTMPFVDGPTLSQRLEREHQLPVDIAIRYTVELAEALEYAHANGILHRDIKPSNVLLISDHAVLADFGVARALDSSAHDSLTDSGLAVGTAAYMSPEQGSADKVDQRSDIYALGCLLYEMLAGSPPFTGATTQAILARHMVDPVPNIRTVRSTVNAATQGVIERALAKTPADRFATVAEFRDALTAARTTPDSATRTHGRTRYVVSAVAMIAVIAGLVWWKASSAPLDPNRIVSFPLNAPASVGGSTTAGEDVATLIGVALDRHGDLRIIDGWGLLDASQRNTAPNQRAARSIASAQGAAYFLTGKIVGSTDSAEVVLDLYDTKGDTSIAKASGRGPATDLRGAAQVAINRILPKLLPNGAARDFAPAWGDRDPGAVAAFLRGEAAFRRARYAQAFESFRQSFGVDSNFALAAVRAAQAASASHRQSEANELIHAALKRPMPSARYQAFARGYGYYLDGFADSAVGSLLAALKADPQMASAWALLGETYVHLIPSGANPDSMAEAAFDSARAYDPGTYNSLLHSIEIRLRRGDIRGAEPLLNQLLGAKPDTDVVVQAGTFVDCVRDGPGKVDWQKAVRTSGASVTNAAAQMGAHGAALGCAAAAYQAVLDYDTAATPGSPANRQSSLLGLVGVLMAQGRTGDLKARIEKSIARGDGGSSLYLIAATVNPEMDAPAAAVALKDSTRFAPDFSKCSSTERCWMLTMFESSHRHAANADALARMLEKRTTPDSALIIHNAVRSALTHAALARGDSAGALRSLRELIARPLPTGSSLQWLTNGALGADRLAYAQLLMASKQYAAARDVAQAFDSPASAILPLYLRPSLELRAEASEKLNDTRAANTYRSRLSALSSSTAR